MKLKRYMIYRPSTDEFFCGFQYLGRTHHVPTWIGHRHSMNPVMYQSAAAALQGCIGLGDGAVVVEVEIQIKPQ